MRHVNGLGRRINLLCLVGMLLGAIAGVFGFPQEVSVAEAAGPPPGAIVHCNGAYEPNASGLYEYRYDASLVEPTTRAQLGEGMFDWESGALSICWINGEVYTPAVENQWVYDVITYVPQGKWLVNWGCQVRSQLSGQFMNVSTAFTTSGSLTLRCRADAIFGGQAILTPA